MLRKETAGRWARNRKPVECKVMSGNRKNLKPARGAYRRAGFPGSAELVAFDSNGILRLVVKALDEDADDYILGWMREWLDRKDPVVGPISTDVMAGESQQAGA